jgi:hypothetical protein
LGGNTVRIYNVADPANIIEVGSWTPPAWVYRLRFVSPYLYAACYDAGVCILDTAMVGIGDTGQGSRITATATVWPTVVRDRLLVAASDPAARVTLYSATGADVTAEAGSTDSNGPCRGMDMGKLPAGVYIVRVSNQGGMTFTAKVIKANGR